MEQQRGKGGAAGTGDVDHALAEPVTPLSVSREEEVLWKKRMKEVVEERFFS